VLVSIVLGALIVIIGLQLRSRVQTAQDTIVGLLLIGAGVALAVFELTGRGHSHPHPRPHPHAGHSHPHSHPHPQTGHDHPYHEPHTHHHADPRLHSLAAIMGPFGVAASPDVTILPVFLAASTVSAGAAAGSLVVFAAATIGTIVGLTVAATFGGYQFRSRWLDRWGNALTAGVLIVIGALVLAGVL
jgi:nickel/cobalt transporter (NicO) family protein